MNDLTRNDAIIYLVVFLVCLGVSAFFSSAEIAFVNLQKVRLKHLQETGKRGADTVARIMERPERFLSVVRTSISFTETIVVAIGGFLVVYLLSDLAGFMGDDVAALIGIILMAMILLLFVKVLPKTLAAQHPEWLALHYAPIIDATSTVVSPIVRVLSWITDKVTGPTGAHFVGGSLMTKEELHTCIAISHETGAVDDTSAQMLKRVVKFGDSMVREIMVPRTEAVWVEEGTTFKQFQKRAPTSQSRICIFD